MAANPDGPKTLHEYLTTPFMGEETMLDVGGTTGDRKVTLALKRIPKLEAEKARSPARCHVFYEAATFAAYLAKYGSKDVVVWADPVGEEFHASLDEKAERGFEHVSMEPQIHPLWAPWANLLARRTVPLDDFARHLSENRRTIHVPDARTLAYLFGQVKAAVSVEIHRGRGKDAVNGVIVRTKVQGAEQGKPDLVEIPDEIVVRSSLYVQTAQREIGLDLLVDATADGKVMVTVTAGTLAEAKVAVFEEMVDAVEKGVGSKATVCYGRPAMTPWQTLA